MLYIGQKNLEKVKFTTVSAQLLGNILFSENIWIHTYLSINKDDRLDLSNIGPTYSSIEKCEPAN